MPLDEELVKAVRRATEELGESEQVANRLVAWLKDAGVKELSKEDKAAHLQDVFSALKGGDE